MHWRELLSRRFDTPNQGPMTTWLSQRLGAVFASIAFTIGLSPNAVTLCGLCVAILGCIPFVYGTSLAQWLLAGFLWQVAFALDCADGQLARATQRSSRYGGWLDVCCDHIRQSSLIVSTYAVVEPVAGAKLALFCSFLFAAGLSAYLHTASMMSVLKPPQLELQGRQSTLQQAVRTVLDTPVLLMALIVMRPQPTVLAMFVAAYGALLLLRTAVIGRRLKA